MKKPRQQNDGFGANAPGGTQGQGKPADDAHDADWTDEDEAEADAAMKAAVAAEQAKVKAAGGKVTPSPAPSSGAAPDGVHAPDHVKFQKFK